MVLSASSRIDRAAVYARDALRGRVSPYATQESVSARGILFNGAYEAFFSLVCLAHLLIVQWEPPAIISPTSSTGIARTACTVVDVFALLIYAGDVFVLQRRYFGAELWGKRGWTRTKIAALLVLVVNLIVARAMPGSPYFARVLRPLFLIERKSTVRKIAANMVKSFAQIAFVACLVALHVVLFAVMALILFAGVQGRDLPGGVPDQCTVLHVGIKDAPVCSVFFTTGCSSYFTNLEESLIHMFAMLTGAEFPGVMLPAMSCNSSYSLVFLVAFVTGNYLLLNLAIAVTNSAIRENMRREVLSRYKNMFDGFDSSFGELVLGTDTPVAMPPAMISSMVKSASAPAPSSTPHSAHEETTLSTQPRVQREDYVKFLSQCRPDLSPVAAGKFFDVIDSTRSGFFTVADHRKMLFHFGRLRALQVRSRGSVAETATATAGDAVESGNDDALEETMDEYFDGDADGVPMTGDVPVDIGAGPVSVVSVPNPLANTAAFSPQAEPPTPSPREWGSSTASKPTAPASLSSNAEGLSKALSSYFAGDVDGVAAQRSDLMRRGVPRSIARESVRGRILAFLHSLPARIFFEICGVVNVVCVLSQLGVETDSMTSAEQAAVDVLHLVNYITYGIFGLEVLSAIALLGPRLYWRQGVWARVDVFVIVLALFGTIVDKTIEKNNNALADLLLVALFFRVAKVLRILRLFPGVSVIVSSFIAMLPAIARYVTVLLCVMYSFAVVGVELFSGHLRRDNPTLVNSAGEPLTAYAFLDFWSLNFDDLLHSLVTLTAQLNIVAWPVVMEALVATTGQHAVRIYFVAFWVCGFFSVLNVTIAFFVEAFSVEKARRERLDVLERALRAELDAREGFGARRAPPVKDFSELESTVRGLSDWRGLVGSSDVDFAGWKLTRIVHHMDIYESIFADDIRAAHAGFFVEGGGRSANELDAAKLRIAELEAIEKSLRSELAEAKGNRRAIDAEAPP